MKFRCLITVLGLILVSIPGQAAAEMSSTNYRIPASVLSGGGAPMASAVYQINATVGQSSPLMDPLEPPLSDTYDLYPGFWYVIAAFESTCPGDFNGDKDVDGSDLAEYIFDSAGLDLEVFAPNFGKASCP